MAGRAGRVSVRPGAARHGRRGKVSSGLVRSGKVWQARYVVVLRGEVSYGELRIGMIGQASYG